MLKRINKIAGVGLFCDTQDLANQQFKRVTLIYGENARGKSTLAEILSSAATGDREPIVERTTIDQAIEPYISILHSSGTEIQYVNGSWNKTFDDLRVFDSRFIEKNVHSGHEVSSDHRKNLLDFVLGASAVDVQEKEREATERKKGLEAQVNLAVSALLQKTQGLSEVEFVSLPQYPDFDSRIEQAKEQLEIASARKTILSLPLPRPVSLPVINMSDLAGLLSTTLEGIHAEAEQEVKKHLEGRNDSAFSNWLVQGTLFAVDETCPYCGQGVDGVALVDAYKNHFNDAYIALKSKIAQLRDQCGAATSRDFCQQIIERGQAARDAIKRWNEAGAQTEDLVVPALDELIELAANTSRDISNLLDEKARALESDLLQSELWTRASESWQRFLDSIDAVNVDIGIANSQIELFKSGLEGLEVAVAQQALQELKLAVLRHSEEVDAEITTIEALRKDLSEAEADRKKFRTELRRLMDQTLSLYGDQINSFLSQQFAPFRIDKLSSNYMGGTPRTQYGIKLRERPVDLAGGEQSFKTALSESDKRMMAFAFFLASIFADPELERRIIVVDDPMSSLDRNRRSNTIKVLEELAKRCAQLIVIAHDPNFLLDLEQAIPKKYADATGAKIQLERSHLKLVPSVLDPQLDPYTDFDTCDLPRECESKYAQNYRVISDFVANPARDSHIAASVIRPLLEGYLHRRFPKLLPANCMFGTAVTEIEKAQLPSPLVAAQDLVPQLRRIAYFGGDAHHDTAPDRPWEGLNATEILGYAKEALALVHG